MEEGFLGVYSEWKKGFISNLPSDINWWTINPLKRKTVGMTFVELFKDSGRRPSGWKVVKCKDEDSAQNLLETTI